MKSFLVGSCVIGFALGGCGTVQQPPSGSTSDTQSRTIAESKERGQSLQRETPPVPLSRPLPPYPAELQKLRIEGVVIVEFVVSETAQIEDPRAVQAPNELLAKLAVDAVKKWKFRPGMKDGKPKAVRLQVPITFAVP